MSGSFLFFFYFFLFFFLQHARSLKRDRSCVKLPGTRCGARGRSINVTVPCPGRGRWLGFDINLRAIYTIHSRPQQSQVKVSLVCVHDYHIVSNMKKRRHFLQKNELPGQVDAEMHTKVCSCQTVIHKMFYKITWFPVNPMCSENVQALPQDSDIRTHKFSVRP